MTERSYHWNTTGGGDGQVYSQSEMMDRFFRAVLNGTGNQGVLHGWLSSLEVTGTASPLSVATGGAVLYGMIYETDAAVSVTVAAPATGSSTYYVVVRRSWAGQTCRIALVTALVQTVNTTYDVPLATITVTAAGVITITDTRDYCTFGTDWPAATIDSEHYAAGAVTPAKIPDRTRYQFRGAGRLETQEGALYGAEWIGAGGIYGVPYDHWRMADAVTDGLWAYFWPPVGLVGGTADFYVWSVPDVNGLGAGAENVHWDINVYQGYSDITFYEVDETATLVDCQLRLEANIYADQVASAVNVVSQAPLAVLIQRAGAQPDDDFFAPMRLLGIGMRFTADC